MNVQFLEEGYRAYYYSNYGEAVNLLESALKVASIYRRNLSLPEELRIYTYLVDAYEKLGKANRSLTDLKMGLYCLRDKTSTHRYEVDVLLRRIEKIQPSH